MKIKDKNLNAIVDVYDKNCPKRQCYWARQYPGVFTQGQGYKKRPDDNGYSCGTREIRGCPDDM